MGNDLDLALTLLLDNDAVAEVVGSALDLDVIDEELLEGSDVEDLVASGLRSVDDELQKHSNVSKSLDQSHPLGAFIDFSLPFM